MKKNVKTLVEVSFNAWDSFFFPYVGSTEPVKACFRLVIDNGVFILDGHLGDLTYYMPVDVSGISGTVTLDNLLIAFHRMINKVTDYSDYKRVDPMKFSKINKSVILSIFPDAYGKTA